MRVTTMLFAGAALAAAAGFTSAAFAEGSYSYGPPHTTYYYGRSTSPDYGYSRAPSYKTYGSTYHYQPPYTRYSATDIGGVDMRGQGSGVNIGKYGSPYMYQHQTDPSDD